MRHLITKYTLLSLVFLLILSPLHASNNGLFGIKKEKKAGETKKYIRSIKRAEVYFNHFAFTRAILHYKKALAENDNDAFTKLQIAESYRMLNDPTKAEEWYATVIEDDKIIKSQHKLRYAEVLTTNGKYEEAKIWYEKANEEIEGDRRPNERLDGLVNRENFYQDSLSYFVQASNVNTEEYDFSPTYYKEGIVFVSSRGEKSLLKPVYKWDETLFLDLFYSKTGQDGLNMEPEILSKSINTRFHEGPSVFYDNDTKVIFTRNNFNNGKVNTSEDGTNKLKLFFSEQKPKNPNKWTKAAPFVYNSDEYSVGHPTLTSDGKTMYFASDMPGTFGKTDIWKTEFINNAWTTPENLGEEINTSGEEMFPFLKDDKELYFASNGHPGIGGLDLFRSNITAYKREVLNMGYPINTKKDDFGLIMKEKEGYFSSNRDEGKGRDDIYHFWVNQLNIEVQIIDSVTREILHGEISVTDMRTTRALITTLATNGVRFSGIKGREYALGGSLSGYEPNTIDFSTLDIPISDEYFVIQIPLVRKLKGDILVVKNYAMKDQVFSIIGDKIEQFDQSFDSLVSLYESENRQLGEVQVIQNVYYDFDKYNIREDAANDLDKLALILFKYSNLKVTFASHTDSRGSFKYNERLAENRVNAAEDYIFSKGVGVNRLADKQSYGEYELINDCADQDTCDEVAHQLNRRTNIFLSIDKGDGLSGVGR